MTEAAVALSVLYCLQTQAAACRATEARQAEPIESGQSCIPMLLRLKEKHY